VNNFTHRQVMNTGFKASRRAHQTVYWILRAKHSNVFWGGFKRCLVSWFWSPGADPKIWGGKSTLNRNNFMHRRAIDMGVGASRRAR
jgi:hypothetical protein